MAMAARGTRNLDTGEEKLSDETLIEQLRGKARQINRRAIITAVIATVVVFAFPS